MREKFTHNLTYPSRGCDRLNLKKAEGNFYIKIGEGLYRWRDGGRQQNNNHKLYVEISQQIIYSKHQHLFQLNRRM